MLAVWLLLAGPPAAAAPAPATLVVLGDSLSAGYGLPREAAFTSRLEAALTARGYDVRVPDTGVSGETTAGGLSRLDWILADRPTLVLVALGGNDGLRGIDPAATRANLDAILTKLAERGVPAVLAGMLAPRNLGRPYAEAFDALFPELARRHAVPFYPFFLEGVAMRPELNLEDGMHPNAEGVAVMVAGILPTVTAALERAGVVPEGGGGPEGGPAPAGAAEGRTAP
ncbi:arylesterase [Rhodospirillum centenum]|uniref:arylesterase n=1 Tax=Rhodospirillum centenum TaxID=34018 RepID=UPI00030EC049